MVAECCCRCDKSVGVNLDVPAVFDGVLKAAKSHIKHAFKGEKGTKPLAVGEVILNYGAYLVWRCMPGPDC